MRSAIRMQLPTSFRRWVAPAAAPSFREAAQLRTVELALPQSDEVLVRTLYATINAGHDTFVARREGRFSDRTGVVNLGADTLGEVVAVGSDVESVKERDYVTAVFGGGFSEYTTPKAVNCVRVDEPKPEYAALRVAGTFSCCALESVAQIKEGETLLITAACGGVGHIAVQIGKLNGCHVIGTCGSGAKKEKLLELGVDRVVNYREESLAEVLREEYPLGLDCVFDGVGGEIWQTALANLKPNGRILTAGFFSQYPHTGKYTEALEVNLAEGASSMCEMFWGSKNAKHGGKSLIFDPWPRDPEVIQRCKKRALDLFLEGRLTVLVDPYCLETFVGIEQVVNATEYMLKGQNVGKTLMSFK